METAQFSGSNYSKLWISKVPINYNGLKIRLIEERKISLTIVIVSINMNLSLKGMRNLFITKSVAFFRRALIASESMLQMQVLKFPEAIVTIAQARCGPEYCVSYVLICVCISHVLLSF